MKKIFLLLFCFSMLLAESEYEYLDEIAVNSLTDKSSLCHNYTKIYSRYLGAIRNQPLKFLEIGIYKGYSVRMWEQYLPHAELHFIDLTDAIIEHYSEKSNYHFLDQGNEVHLAHFIQKTGGDFDVIVDDGGHHMNQQFASFVNLFPTLKSGGLYIIEDLCTSYWSSFGGGGDLTNPFAGPNTMIGTLKALIDFVNTPSAKTGCADIEKLPKELRYNLNYFQENIVSLHFYDSMCIIEKR